MTTFLLVGVFILSGILCFCFGFAIGCVALQRRHDREYKKTIADVKRKIEKKMDDEFYNDMSPNPSEHVYFNCRGEQRPIPDLRTAGDFPEK